MKINKEMGEMTRKEACEYLGVNYNTLTRFNISHFVFGKIHIYRKSDLDEWRAKQFVEYKEGINGNIK